MSNGNFTVEPQSGDAEAIRLLAELFSGRIASASIIVSVGDKRIEHRVTLEPPHRVVGSELARGKA